MTLPDLVLPSQANQNRKYSGLDSPNSCRDKEHFYTYPHAIEYVYNSRGFRDAEWPNNIKELCEAVWCIGDSFTVGIGQPFWQIWPQVLQSRIGIRTINVSMDGASNDWISRRAQDIYSAVHPDHIIVMWSYLHRREHGNSRLQDYDRRLPHSRSTTTDDVVNFNGCQQRLPPGVLQSIVPRFEPSGVQDLWLDIRGDDWPLWAPTGSHCDLLPDFIKQEIKQIHQCWDKFQSYSGITTVIDLENTVIPCHQIDLARDGHHYGEATVMKLVDSLVRKLGL